MKKRWRIAGLILLVLVLGFVFWRRPSEPEFQGRKLSAWLAGNNWPPDAERAFSESDFTNAIREMGPKALPWLISSLQAEDSLVNKAVRKLPIDNEKTIGV